MDKPNYAHQPGGFVQFGGSLCLGMHYIGEMLGGIGLDDPDFIEKTLRKSARAGGATILHANFHRFRPGGVTGVLVLAESHISIHSWPEHEYAALDIFMCGRSRIDDAVEVLRTDFRPRHLIGRTLLRGQENDMPSDGIECSRLMSGHQPR